MKTKILSLSMLFAMVFVQTLSAQTVNFNMQVAGDTTIGINSKFSGKCSAAHVTASVTLHSDTSLVRVVLVDATGKRRLLLEAYPLICEDTVVNFTAYYEETKYMPYNTNPEAIEFYLVDAACSFNSMGFSNRIIFNYLTLAQQYRLTVETQKANRINQNLEEKGLPWRARITDMNTMDYSQKAIYWGGDKYFVEGYDYYGGGIFCDYSRWDEIIQDIPIEKTTLDPLPPVRTKSFDWRKAHGANLSTSPYFDGNPDEGIIQINQTSYNVIENNGWLTSVKDQHSVGPCPNGCYLFGPIGAIEAVINLYYAQHLDYDLSEQHLMDCFNVYDPYSSCYSGGHENILYDFLQMDNYLFRDEYSYSWLNAMSGICYNTGNDLCEIRIGGLSTVNYDENIFKRALINNGPMAAYPYPHHHATLVGFKTIEPYDTLHINNGFGIATGSNPPYRPDTLVIYPGNKLIGRTMWIFKNSVNLNGGFRGYIYILYDLCSENFNKDAFSYHIPIIDELNENLAVQWDDKDGDGYYFWGIGPKPAACPGPEQEDCDDSDPLRVYYDEYSYCSYDCEALENLISNTPIYITSNTTLNGTLLTRPIIVQGNNVVLTLNGDFECTRNVYIQSEIGTTLNVSEARFMCVCDEFWQGFRVKANLDPTLGPVGRSLLILKNSLIENALCGVSSDAGGIIDADNSVLRNNSMDVLFMPHTNSSYYQQVLGNNTSDFRNCRFETYSYQHNNSNSVYNVVLINTKGVNFNKCVFKDEGIDGKILRIGNRNGIMAYKSGFTVENNTNFYNLSYAIKAYNSEYLPIDVQNNYFENCYFCVYLSSAFGTVITNNEMFFEKSSSPGSTVGEIPPYGIYLDNSLGFEVEGNYIHYKFQLMDIIGPVCGIIVNNSLSTGDEVYRNGFEKLLVAIEAIGMNRDQSDGYYGLLIKCNDIVYSKHNIFVTSDPNYTYPQGAFLGIGKNQGSLTNPAGNLFTTQNGPDYTKIFNSNDPFFNYYYHNPASNSRVYPSIVSGNVWLHETEQNYSIFSCPDNTESSGINPLVLLPQLHNINTAIEEADNNLNALTDGGNTTLTVAEIVLASDLNAWQTYLDLMEKSPYLSDEALQEVARKEDALSFPMVRDVLVANPQAAKDPEIKKILDERIEALPQYMIDQINSGLTQISPKEYLEMQRAELSRTLYQETTKQLRYYLRNTEQYGNADVEALLSISADPEYALQLAMYYASQGNYSIAMNKLNSVETDNSTLQAEIQNLINLYGLLSEINTDTCAINALGHQKIDALFAIENNGGQAGAYARGLLMLNNAIDYKEPVFLPELMNDRKAGTGAIETKAEYLKVYPNPADKYITVEYRIENESENIVLKVADTESRVVYARKLANKEDSQLIDIKDFTQGSYIVYLEVDGKVVDSKIVSVTK